MGGTCCARVTGISRAVTHIALRLDHPVVLVLLSSVSLLSLAFRMLWTELRVATFWGLDASFSSVGWRGEWFFQSLLKKGGPYCSTLQRVSLCSADCKYLSWSSWGWNTKVKWSPPSNSPFDWKRPTSVYFPFLLSVLQYIRQSQWVLLFSIVTPLLRTKHGDLQLGMCTMQRGEQVNTALFAHCLGHMNASAVRDK